MEAREAIAEASGGEATGFRTAADSGREKRVRALREKHRWAILLAKRHCREIQRPLLIHVPKPTSGVATAETNSFQVISELVWPHKRQRLANLRRSDTILGLAQYKAKLYADYVYEARQFMKQLELEHAALSNSALRYRRMVSDMTKRGDGASMSAARKLITRWFKPLSEEIEKEQKRILGRERGLDRRKYGPYLLLLPAKECAVITIHTILQLLMVEDHVHGHVKSVKAASAIGHNFEWEVHLRRNYQKLQRETEKEMKRLEARIEPGQGTPFKGVALTGKTGFERYKVQIPFMDQVEIQGLATAEDAARIYDRVLIHHYGYTMKLKENLLNFPFEDYEQEIDTLAGKNLTEILEPLGLTHYTGVTFALGQRWQVDVSLAEDDPMLVKSDDRYVARFTSPFEAAKAHDRVLLAHYLKFKDKAIAKQCLEGSLPKKKSRKFMPSRLNMPVEFYSEELSFLKDIDVDDLIQQLRNGCVKLGSLEDTMIHKEETEKESSSHKARVAQGKEGLSLDNNGLLPYLKDIEENLLQTVGDLGRDADYGRLLGIDIGVTQEDMLVRKTFFGYRAAQKRRASKQARRALSSVQWPVEIGVKLGAHLLYLLLTTARIPANESHLAGLQQRLLQERAGRTAQLTEDRDAYDASMEIRTSQAYTGWDLGTKFREISHKDPHGRLTAIQSAMRASSEGLHGTSGPMQGRNFMDVDNGHEAYVGKRADNAFRYYEDGEEAMNAIFKPCAKTGTVPAFVHGYGQEQLKFPRKARSQGSSGMARPGLVAWHPLVPELLEKEHISREALDPKFKPMVVRPRPWESPETGGYLVGKSYILRSRVNTHYRQDLEAIISGQSEDGSGDIVTPRPRMYQIYEALTALSAVPWRINRQVLEVAEALWAEGTGRAGLVSLNDVEVPENPEYFFRARRKRKKGEPLERVSQEEFERLIQQKRLHREAIQRNQDMHSQRCDTLLKLAIASDFRDEEKLFFPHNLDFRGRAYPLHPHLNHLGNDMCRGLLSFAQGQPLGKTGLKWLYVQLANLYGKPYDKLPTLEREAAMRGLTDQIIQSANDPLPPGRLWENAEDPFQFLATCFEIRDALASGDPESYISHIPVHQDGSCNGLQHYAALGRDDKGGPEVNLTPRDRPADLYTGLADLLRERVEADAKAGDALAIAVLPEIDRKLVKQTVMTSVYGVTYIGARDQIQARLRERGWSEGDRDLQYNASAYVARRCLESMNTMFSDAKDVMRWLTDCAQLVARTNQPVKWITPLGLPVLQPYANKQFSQVKTSLQSLWVMSHDQTIANNVNKYDFAAARSFCNSAGYCCVV
eukprot:scaffold422_cov399-Prasinococcus_capsulatus_cf.AAC.12